MFRLEWLFFMQILLGIIMIVFLQKLTQMKKQVDEIVREVNSYIAYITEDEDKTLGEEKRIERKNQENMQNQLIEAVLGEYFP